MARDLYQTVTDRILAKLETGTSPWAKPYSRNAGVPCNAATGRPYQGINFVMLHFLTEALGYAKPRYLTFGQAKNLGGHIKRGEHGTKVYFFKPMTKVDKESGEEKKFFFLRDWDVFNVDQCAGLPVQVVEGDYVPELNKDVRNSAADEFIKATGVDFREGKGNPCYIPSRDYILMPKWSEFHGHDNFYATAFHELVHWTGHKDRLDRDQRNLFRTPGYAAEELVAELGAAFLCAEFGFDMTDNNASYIASWIKLLKDNKKAIFTASAAAQKAVDFLKHKVLVDAEESEAEIEKAA